MLGCGSDIAPVEGGFSGESESGWAFRPSMSGIAWGKKPGYSRRRSAALAGLGTAVALSLLAACGDGSDGDGSGGDGSGGDGDTASKDKGVASIDSPSANGAAVSASAAAEPGRSQL